MINKQWREQVIEKMADNLCYSLFNCNLVAMPTDAELLTRQASGDYARGDILDAAEATFNTLIQELPELTYTIKSVEGWTQLPIEHTPCETVDNGSKLYKQIIAMKEKTKDST